MAADDRHRLAVARRLAELAGEHVDECIKTALAVMRDVESRQRLAAAQFLIELSMGAGGAAGGGGTQTKVLVINGDQIRELEQRTREAKKAQVVEATVKGGDDE